MIGVSPAEVTEKHLVRRALGKQKSRVECALIFWETIQLPDNRLHARYLTWLPVQRAMVKNRFYALNVNAVGCPVTQNSTLHGRLFDHVVLWIAASKFRVRARKKIAAGKYRIDKGLLACQSGFHRDELDGELTTQGHRGNLGRSNDQLIIHRDGNRVLVAI